MRIVHVAEYATGGVATYLRNAISYQMLDSQIDEIILICAKVNSEQFEFKSPKVRCVTFDYVRSLGGLYKLLAVRKVIDGLEADVVHFHSSFAGLIRLTYFLKPCRYQVIYCAHGWSFIQQGQGRLKKQCYRLVERVCALRTTKIINISESESRQALHHGLPAKKMQLIYNTIPNELSTSAVTNPFATITKKKVLFVGRFDKAKGLDFLLQSVNFKNLGIELVVIGESVLGDINAEFKQQSVPFLGWIDHQYIDAYMQHCDAVIIPSRWEGFGLVALEAMKNQKMVIASDAGGLAEIVIDGYNGLRFKTNSAQDLNSALEKFSQMSQGAIQKMGRAGAKIQQHKYNFSQMNQQLVELYRDGSAKNGQSFSVDGHQEW